MSVFTGYRSVLSNFARGGVYDAAFTANGGAGANQSFEELAVQPDNKIIAGGFITQWDGTTVNGIVRLSSDGKRDTAFTTNTGTAGNDGVFSVTLQSDGKIVAGGFFTTWNGTTVNRIVRLNSDGTRDIDFTTNTGTAAGSNIRVVRVQSDGKIIVGGAFASWDGATVGGLVRLNSDGTRDTTFTTNTGTAGNLRSDIAEIQSDGKIVVGGQFSTWNGTTVNRIVRLNSDGTRDIDFTTNTGTAASAGVRALAVQSDGKIIVGGSFTTWDSTTVNYIVRLNSDGTRDTTFTTNTGTAGNNEVRALAIQSDGKIVVGGAFTTWNGATVNRIVRLNSDGTRDTEFTTNIGTGANGPVVSTFLQLNNRVLFSGAFTTWNDLTVNSIVRVGGNKA